MKPLTNEEKILVGTLWDSGLGIHSIAIRIHNKRNEMNEYYLAEMVAEELDEKVICHGQGTD